MTGATDGRPTGVLSAELSAAVAAYHDLAAEATRAWAAYLKAQEDVRAARNAWQALEYRALIASRKALKALGEDGQGERGS